MNTICFVGENLYVFFFLSCKFSEDGQQLFAILETKSFQIYNIHDTTLDFLAEEDTILLSALLESTGIGKKLLDKLNILSIY